MEYQMPEIERIARANGRGRPARTRADVEACLIRDQRKNDGTDLTMARMMVRHGNLTDDAREFARAWLAMYGE